VKKRVPQSPVCGLIEQNLMRKRNTVAAMAASTDKNPLNISKLSAEERAWFASNSVPSFDAASTVNSGTKTTSATTTTTTTTVVADDVVEEGIRKRVRSSRADVNPPPQLSSTREEREWLLQQVATREANAHDLSSARPKNVKVNIAANQPAPTSLPQLTLEEENEKCFGDAFLKRSRPADPFVPARSNLSNPIRTICCLSMLFFLSLPSDNIESRRQPFRETLFRPRGLDYYMAQSVLL
jgi:hypothetical protein